MKKFLSIAVLFILTLHFTSCDDIDIMSPAGPAGMGAYELWVEKVESGEIQWAAGTDEANFFKFLQGENGSSGADAYEIWKEYIKAGTIKDPHNPNSVWSPNKNTMEDYYSFLTGANGDAGLTPRVNDAGNWQIGDVDTGIPAKGQNGTSVDLDPITGNWVIDGEDSGIPAEGKDGTMISIGTNGNWIIDGQETQLPSNGKDGTVVTMDPVTGNWVIDGVDSGISYKGKDGTNGTNGKDGTVVTMDPTTGNWVVDGVDSGISYKGKDGSDGSEVTMDATTGNWVIDGVDTGIPYKGDPGAPGKAGSVVTMDPTTGNWVIDGVDSGISYKGKDGTNGINGSKVTMNSITGNWVIDGVDTGISYKGKDGTNGKNGTLITMNTTTGNWEVDGVDTGISYKGKDGTNGTDGKDAEKVTIGANGNWYIGTTDTGVPSKGEKGENGTPGTPGAKGNDGTSAYEIWKEEVKNGDIDDKDGNQWPTNSDTLNDFWDYLTGESAPGITIEITPLEFVKSSIDSNDITKETFEFKTDAGAIVTMSYKGTKITGIADGNGICKIEVKNDEKNEIPILVSAIVTGKYESTGYLLNVKPRAAVFEFEDFAIWYDASGTEMNRGNGTITHPIMPTLVLGEYMPNADPRLITMNTQNFVSYITIPFEAENVQDVVLLGGITTNFIMSVEWNADRKGGYIKLEKPSSSWTLGKYVVTLQIISNSKELSFIKLQAQVNS